MIYDGGVFANKTEIEVRMKPSVRYFTKNSQGRFQARVKGYTIYFGRTVYYPSESKHKFETTFTVQEGFVEYEFQVCDIFVPGDAMTYLELEGKYLAKYIIITEVINNRLEDSITKITFDYKELFSKVKNGILEVKKWDAETKSHTKIYLTGRLTSF